MAQSRKKSLAEVLVNVGTGFLISLIITYLAAPILFGVAVSGGRSLAITLVYTSISIARGYIVRRLFNRLEK